MPTFGNLRYVTLAVVLVFCGAGVFFGQSYLDGKSYMELKTDSKLPIEAVSKSQICKNSYDTCYKVNRIMHSIDGGFYLFSDEPNLYGHLFAVSANGTVLGSEYVKKPEALNILAIAFVASGLSLLSAIIIGIIDDSRKMVRLRKQARQLIGKRRYSKKGTWVDHLQHSHELRSYVEPLAEGLTDIFQSPTYQPPDAEASINRLLRDVVK